MISSEISLRRFSGSQIGFIYYNLFWIRDLVGGPPDYFLTFGLKDCSDVVTMVLRGMVVKFI